PAQPRKGAEERTLVLGRRALRQSVDRAIHHGRQLKGLVKKAYPPEDLASVRSGRFSRKFPTPLGSIPTESPFPQVNREPAVGFEPTTYRLQVGCATGLRHAGEVPESTLGGTPDRLRRGHRSRTCSAGS